MVDITEPSQRDLDSPVVSYIYYHCLILKSFLIDLYFSGSEKPLTGKYENESIGYKFSLKQVTLYSNLIIL